MQSTEIDHIIGDIYSAVTAPDGFQQFVNRLVTAFRLKAAMLFTHNALNGEAKGMWQQGIAREWMERYAIEYGPEDMLAKHLATSSIASFYASNVHLSEAQYTNSRFYREWIIPQGVGSAAGAVVLREGVWSTQVVLQRSMSQPKFTELDLQLLDRLVTHLQRAVQMRHRFGELHRGKMLFTAGLDVVAMPSILLDEWGCVLYCNRAADLLMTRGNGLWVDNHYLCTNNLALTKQLNLEVLLAVGTSRGSGTMVPGVVVIPRPERASLTLMVLPMNTPDSELKGAAVLFIYDPSESPAAKPGLVARLFSLTLAEAELAVALCSGKTLEEAAIVRRTSVHTVRSQLKSIFNKTGTHRQTDLVTLLLSSPAYFVTTY